MKLDSDTVIIMLLILIILLWGLLLLNWGGYSEMRCLP
jgi:hypothetical protein